MPTLDWIGKDAVVDHHRQVPYHLLHCDGALSAGPPGEGNLLIEGDNLLALKALLPYYAGKVKCIYIDPPYNTGNEGWVYNDNVNSPEIRRWLHHTVGAEAEDLSRHDKWLCMMYPRLVLLKQFLREDGAIFVSIDDNELPNLRAILSDVFGERNFIATIIWQKVFSPKNSARHLSDSHDYVVLFARDADTWRPNLIPRSSRQDARYKNPDNDPRGPWASGDLSARNYYSLGRYAVTSPSGRIIPGPPPGTYWRVSEETFAELEANKRIWWGKHGNNVPRLKRFLSEVKEGVTTETIWFHTEVGHTQEAKKEVVSLLPDESGVFISPKPTRLIRRIIELAADKDSIILDSFAGSGTTGHAVIAANREDGGNRRFILVEMEPKIARNVTAERLRRVAGGGEAAEQLAGGAGFRYCTLGETLFDAEGRICPGVRFSDLAHHIFFTETGEPLPPRRPASAGDSPASPQSAIRNPQSAIGTLNGIAYSLLWTGAPGGGILDAAALRSLAPHDGLRVVYADQCRLSPARLARENIVFKQVPYEVSVR